MICWLPVAIAKGRRSSRGVAVNISRCGAYVRTKATWPHGVALTFTIRAGQERTISLTGQIVHMHEGRGMGVVFLEDQALALMELGNFLKELSKEGQT